MLVLTMLLSQGTRTDNPLEFQGADVQQCLGELTSADGLKRRSACTVLRRLAEQVQQAFADQKDRVLAIEPAGNRAQETLRLDGLSAPAAWVVAALQPLADRDLDPTVQQEATTALRAWKATAKDMTNAYRMLLKDGDFGPRMFAARNLGNLGPLAADAIADLQQAARDRDDRVRKEASRALGKIQGNRPGERDPQRLASVQAVLPLLQDQKNAVRMEAAGQLGKLCQGHAAAAKLCVPALIDRLQKDADSGVRLNAARSLGQIGELARDALPALRAAARDRAQDVREACHQAIQQIGN